MRTAVIALLVAVLALAGGCQVLPWMVAQFSPPEKIKAVYVPPKDKKVLVLVENRQGLIGKEIIRYELMERLGKKLVEHKVAASVVPVESLEQLSFSGAPRNSSPSDLAQRFGADLVVYVQIDHVSLKDNPVDPLWHGLLRTNVCVIDGKAKTRLWPTDLPDGMGHIVPQVEVKMVDNPSPDYADTMIVTMAERAADNISKLFYDHYVSVDPVQDMPKSELDRN